MPFDRQAGWSNVPLKRLRRGRASSWHRWSGEQCTFPSNLALRSAFPCSSYILLLSPLRSELMQALTSPETMDQITLGCSGDLLRSCFDDVSRRSLRRPPLPIIAKHFPWRVVMINDRTETHQASIMARHPSSMHPYLLPLPASNRRAKSSLMLC